MPTTDQLRDPDSFINIDGCTRGIHIWVPKIGYLGILVCDVCGKETTWEPV